MRTTGERDTACQDEHDSAQQIPVHIQSGTDHAFRLILSWSNIAEAHPLCLSLLLLRNMCMSTGAYMTLEFL